MWRCLGVIGRRRYTLNVGIVAHIDAGKTTLTESILVASGAKSRLGTVDGGTTTTDYLKEERERGVTIQSACVTVKWKNATLNLYDTPGHAEFGFEVERVLPALDLCLLVLDGSKGVETQTKTVLRAARRRELPIISFVNKMDKPNANFAACIKSMNNFNLAPLVLRDDYLTCDELHENLSMVDDQFAEDYLDEQVTNEKVNNALIRALSASSTPVFSGAAKNGTGVTFLLDYLAHLAVESQLANQNKELSARCFKITSHPRHGQLNLFRNFGIEMATRRKIDFVNRTASGGVGKCSVHQLQADDVIELEKLVPNQIFVIPGDINVNTGDVISIAKSNIQTDLINDVLPPAHSCSTIVEPERTADMPKLRKALKVMSRQDPSFSYEIDELDQVTLKGRGKFHLEICVSRLEHENKVKDLVMWPVQVEYKESPIDATTKVYETLIPEDGPPMRMTIEVNYSERAQFASKSVKVGNWKTPLNNRLQDKMNRWLSDAVTMAAYAGPLKKSPITNCSVFLNHIELANADDLAKLETLANQQPIKIVRGAIQMMKRVFDKVDFELIEPDVNYELSIYDREYIDKARRVLIQLECDIGDEVTDPDIDLTTIYCSCKVSKSFDIDALMKRATSGNAFLSTIE